MKNVLRCLVAVLKVGNLVLELLGFCFIPYLLEFSR